MNINSSKLFSLFKTSNLNANSFNKDYNNFTSTPKNTRKSYKKDINSDYSQLYSGEPPPSYKVAKYLPSAEIFSNSSKEKDKNCVSASSTNQYIHIYENIDDNYVNNLILNDNKSSIFENNIINIKTDANQ